MFQIPTLERPLQLGPSVISWRRVSLCCGWCWRVPGNGCVIAPLQQLRVNGKLQHTAGVSVCCPQQRSLFLPIPVNWPLDGSHWVDLLPKGGEPNHFYEVTPSRRTASPCLIQGILRQSCLFWGAPPCFLVGAPPSANL